jgi:hypothetical protein
MIHSPDLESPYGDLTEEVRIVRQDAAANRGVHQPRGEMHDFRRATTDSVNAIREDLTDLRTQVRQEFADVRAEMRNGFEQADRNFLEIRGRLDGTAAGLSVVTDLITRPLEQRGHSGDRAVRPNASAAHGASAPRHRLPGGRLAPPGRVDRTLR